ncbi:hypothetical protein ACMYR3_12570 [Ampullimonas aquatilis]|uniref:hypothetical protein n=1 Tax=Ampullimonas aquatilis TaxID=1341549 RepID=UPI003C77FAB3
MMNSLRQLLCLLLLLSLSLMAQAHGTHRVHKKSSQVQTSKLTPEFIEWQKAHRFDIDFDMEIHHQLTMCPNTRKALGLPVMAERYTSHAVCAARETGVVCCCAPCPGMISWHDYANGAEACADEQVEGFYEQACETYKASK